MRAAVAFLALSAVLPGPARAQDDPACARFEEPLAYNACLASHGPRANTLGNATGAAGVRRTDPEEETPARAKAPPQPFQPFQPFQHVERRRGRVHMEFRLR